MVRGPGDRRSPGDAAAEGSDEERIDRLVAAVAPVDEDARRGAQERIDGLVKPPGSLGRVETVAAQLAAIAGHDRPPVPARPTVVIAAGDHGVHGRGVTPWPQAITAAMVAQFGLGRASVNAIATTVGADVVVLDVGVATDVPDAANLHRVRVRAGTDDLSTGSAMTVADAHRAVLAGADETLALIDDGVDLMVTGDMGIANTTATSCLVAAFCGCDVEAVLGRGAAIDDDSLARKRGVIAEALDLHREVVTRAAARPLEALAAVGGLEHAALAGIILAAATRRVPVILDGVITDAAALVARALAPDVVGHLVAGHRSTEPAATLALDALGLAPLLEMDLRLGEGTGGLLAVPIVQAAARLLHDVAAIADL